jgi:hypothetical protein
MTSSPATPHLDNHHRNTLRQIFQHPVSHNIEWHAVVSLLEAIGTVDVQIGSEREILEPPVTKDIDEQMVLDLRRMLSRAGYDPA